MLMTFKSRASSDVTYFKAVATDILILLGKNPEASQGVFTVEQLGPAIVTLKRVIETDKTTPVLNQNNEDAEDEQIQVHLYQRAIPLLTLFERSKTAKKPVTWGV